MKKYRYLLYIALMLVLIAGGCARLLKPEAQQPTATIQFTPPVPIPDLTQGPIMTITTDGSKNVPENVVATATPVIIQQTVDVKSLATATPVAPAATVDVGQIQAVTETVEVPANPVQPVSQADYPSTPEDVVTAFLSAYRDNPDDMITYLSSSLIAGLPVSGTAGAVQLSGSLDGFTIQAGSASADPVYAVVQVLVRMNGADTVRIFQLIQEDGQWKISFADIARG